MICWIIYFRSSVSGNNHPRNSTQLPSSWEYIFQPSTFPSRLKKYTPTCFGVPLVGLGAPSCLVRLHSVPAFFLGVQSHIRRSMQHQSLRLYPCCWPPLRTLFGTRHKSKGSFPNEIEPFRYIFKNDLGVKKKSFPVI